MQSQRMDYGRGQWSQEQTEAETRLKEARKAYRNAEVCARQCDCDGAKSNLEYAKKELDVAGKAMTEAFSMPARLFP